MPETADYALRWLVEMGADEAVGEIIDQRGAGAEGEGCEGHGVHRSMGTGIAPRRPGLPRRAVTRRTQRGRPVRSAASSAAHIIASY